MWRERAGRDQSAAPAGAVAGIAIGTSGWSYDSWRGPLFPPALVRKDWLSFYAAHFNSVEINSGFYRTPTLEAVRSWREQTPRDFTFAWKASKFITHWKRLTERCENSIVLMETRLRVLGPKVKIVLFQLPARFAKNPERLDSFLDMLPRRYRYAFEFRDDGWYAEDIFALLRARNVALCISDHADAPAPWLATAKHVYVRGHGPTGKYHGSYPLRTLRRWTEAIRAWQAEGREVFVYFDNDQKAAAPKDALRLMKLLMPAPKATRSAKRRTARRRPR